MDTFQRALREALFTAFFGGIRVDEGLWDILGHSINDSGLGIPYLTVK